MCDGMVYWIQYGGPRVGQEQEGSDFVGEPNIEVWLRNVISFLE